MSRKCQITGKRPLVGNKVSHAKNRTKMRQLPNLQWKRIFVPELDRFVRVRICHKAMRTIDKMGLLAYLKKKGLKIESFLR